MSRTLVKQWPSILLSGKEKNTTKRKKLIKACCDTNFVKAIAECCWNIINGRVPLSHKNKQQLGQHKQLLRRLGDKSTPNSKKRTALQSGGFASLLPLIVGPVASVLASLFKR